MKRTIKYILILPLLILSCRKEQQETNPSKITENQGSTLTVEQVKTFYKSDTSNNIHWDKAVYVPAKKGSYWLVGLDGHPHFQSMGLGYRQLLFYRDTDKKRGVNQLLFYQAIIIC